MTMKRTYIAPKVTVLDYSPSCGILASTSSMSTQIYNDNIGGDDGQGGYNPGNSLSRGNGSSGNGLWDEVW